MADVSFITPGLEKQPGIYTQNPDYTVQAQEIARRRALSDALLARSLQPIPEQPAVGGLAVPISPLQGVSGLVQQFFAAKMGKDLSGQEADLSKRYTAARASGVSNLMAPDASEAQFIQAMGSTDPVQAAIGKTLFESRVKDRQERQKLAATFPNASLNTRRDAAMSGNLGGLASETKTIDVNGNLVRVGEGQAPQPEGYFGPDYIKNPDGTTKITQIKGADGQLEPYVIESRSGKPVKLDQAPKINITATAGVAGPKAGAEAIFKDAANTVKDLGTAARSGQQVKENLARMQALDQRGVFSNVQSGAQTFLANLAQGAGIKLSPEQLAKLGNTETYNALVTESWQKLISQMGGNRGVTAQEAEQIKSILPQTKDSPQARAQLYQILGNVADRQQAQFVMGNSALTKALKANDPSIWQENFANVFSGTPSAPPAAPVPGGGAVPSTPKVIKWGDLPK